MHFVLQLGSRYTSSCRLAVKVKILPEEDFFELIDEHSTDSKVPKEQRATLSMRRWALAIATLEAVTKVTPKFTPEDPSAAAIALPAESWEQLPDANAKDKLFKEVFTSADRLVFGRVLNELHGSLDEDKIEAIKGEIRAVSGG